MLGIPQTHFSIYAEVSVYTRARSTPVIPYRYFSNIIFSGRRILAEIADLSTVYISYIENAKRKPSLESLIKISNALEITIDELLYGNLLYNPTEYQTDIDLLMADCTSTEKRYIFEVLSAIKNILRINDWHLSSKHNYDADNPNDY